MHQHFFGLLCLNLTDPVGDEKESGSMCRTSNRADKLKHSLKAVAGALIQGRMEDPDASMDRIIDPWKSWETELIDQ